MLIIYEYCTGKIVVVDLIDAVYQLELYTGQIS